MLKAKETPLTSKSRKQTGLSLLATSIRKGRAFDVDDVIRSPVPKPKDPEFLDDKNE